MFILPKKPANQFNLFSQFQWLIFLLIQYVTAIAIGVSGVLTLLFFIGVWTLPTPEQVLWITVVIFIVSYLVSNLKGFITPKKANESADTTKTVPVPIVVNFLSKKKRIILNFSLEADDPREAKDLTEDAEEILEGVFNDLTLDITAG